MQCEVWHAMRGETRDAWYATGRAMRGMRCGARCAASVCDAWLRYAMRGRKEAECVKLEKCWSFDQRVYADLPHERVLARR